MFKITNENSILQLNISDVEDVCLKILLTRETPLEIAKLVVDQLITSEMSGYSSHGVLRILEYAECIEQGLISVSSVPRIQKIDSSSSIIHGNKSFGAITLEYAIKELSETLTRKSIAIIGIRKSNHLGRIGHLTSKMAQNGFITIGFVNYMGGGQNVPIWKGTEGRLCTNPITIGFPKTKSFDPIIIDMSTSNVSEGKIRKHKIYNQNLENGALIDQQWNYVNDPKGFYEKTQEVFLAPLGGKNYGYKGYALSLATEILAGILTNSGFSQENTKNNQGNGGFFIVIKPDILGTDIGKVLADIEDLALYLCESKSLDDNVFLPGERSQKHYKLSQKNGYLTLSKKLWENLLLISGG